MKLPQVQYRGVESLGRADTGALSVAAGSIQQEGRAEQQAANVMASIAHDYQNRKEDAEYNDQVVSMQLEMDEWQSRHAVKQFYTSAELGDIPEDVVPRENTYTDENGDQVSEFRDNIPAHEVYPLLLQQKLEGTIKDKAGKISNTNLRNNFIDKAKLSASDQMLKASVAAEQQQQAYMLRVGEEKADAAAQNGNLDAAVFQIENMEVDDVTKRALIKKAETQVEIYGVTQAIRSTDPETVMTFRAIYEDENYDGNLNESQRQGAIADLNARLGQLGAEQDAAEANAHAMTVNGLSVGIVDGQVSRLELDAAYSLWQADDTDPRGINPKEHTALVKQLSASQSGSESLAELRTLGQDLLSGRVRGDVTNRDHVKAVEQIVVDQGLTQDNVHTLGVLTKRIGIVPQVLQSRINGMALEGPPEEQEVALVMYDNLVATAPHVAAQFGTEARKVLNLAAQFRNGGAPTPQAFKNARQYRVDVTPQNEKDYLQNYRDQRSDGNIDERGDLQDMMDEDLDDTFEYGMFGLGDTEASMDMTMDFAELTKLYYPMTKGNIQMAQSAAYRDLKGKYGKTGVGLSANGEEGTRASAYPPEMLLQADTGEVNTGLKAYAEANGVNVERIMLRSTPNTPKDHTWNVVEFDEDLIPQLRAPFHGSTWLVTVYEQQQEEKREEARTYRDQQQRLKGKQPRVMR